MAERGPLVTSEVELFVSDRAREVAAVIASVGAYQTYFDQPRESWPVWTDGTVCPAYCNVRSMNGSPEGRMVLSSAMEAITRERLDTTDNLSVVALSTAGISWGTTLANSLNLPLAIDRGKPKEHGTGDRIDGLVVPGSKAIIVDDAIASGGSIISARDYLRDVLNVETAAVVAGVAISDETSSNRWSELGKIKVLVATDFTHLVACQFEAGKMNEEQRDNLLRFYRDTKAQITW